MSVSFLKAYKAALPTLEGWLLPDAALMFVAYNQLIAKQGIAGDVMEIGVYHGKSAILMASLRGSDHDLYAIDLFDDMQSYNSAEAGAGMKAGVLHNLG